MQIAELKAQLQSKKLLPFYLFTGNRAVMQRALDQLPKYQVYSSVEQALPHLASKSLFGGYNVAVVVNDAAVLQMAADAIVRVVRAGTLVLVCDTLDARTKLAKSAFPYLVEFEDPTDDSLVRYVRQQLNVSQNIAYSVLFVCNKDLNQIEHLCHMLKYLDKVETSHVYAFSSVVVSENAIFSLLDALMKKDAESAWMIYTRLVSKKADHMAWLLMLYTRFRALLLVSAYAHLLPQEISGKTGLSYYMISQLLNFVNTFSSEQLKQILYRAQKSEVEVKTSVKTPEMALDNLILFILQVS